MKKFILSLVTFVLGVVGVLICLINGVEVKSVHTVLGTSDSLERYYYALSSPAIIGLLIFGLVTIFGLVFSIKNAQDIEK